MDKLLISVFDTDEAAYDGLAALRQLDRDGDITLFESTLITKDLDGHASVQDKTTRPPQSVTVGAVGGALVGLVGGPATAILGASLGAAGGALYEGFRADAALDIVDDASRALEPGTAAIVADIDESWTIPVDTRLGALGARTSRRVKGASVDEQLARDSETAALEVDDLRARLRDASPGTRAQVAAAMTSERESLDDLITRIDSTLEQERTTYESHMAKLQAQLGGTAEQQHERINERIAEMQASHTARRATLQGSRAMAARARELAAEALES